MGLSCRFNTAGGRRKTNTASETTEQNGGQAISSGMPAAVLHPKPCHRPGPSITLQTNLVLPQPALHRRPAELQYSRRPTATVVSPLHQHLPQPVLQGIWLITQLNMLTETLRLLVPSRMP